MTLCKILFLLVASLLRLTSSTSSSAATAMATAFAAGERNVDDGIVFRRGMKADEPIIAATMARSLMNPLGIDGSRFLVAENDRGERIGWAQLRPLGPSAADPSALDAPPGSGDVERLTDEEMWDRFEEEGPDFPNGLASLPWTKEYRAAAEAARKRRDGRNAVRARVRSEAGQLWELASVFVFPEYRGKGVGSELVRRMMAEHAILGRSPSDVYALTLETTLDWYEALGFSKTDEIPAPMKFEVAAGSVITKLIGAQLACVRGGQSSQ